MVEQIEDKTLRKRIAWRLFFTILCAIILHVVQFVIQVITLIQYIILLVTRTHNEPLRTFSNQAATLMYRLVRYITLNENTKPFPFNDFPPVIDVPEDPIIFD